MKIISKLLKALRAVLGARSLQRMVSRLVLWFEFFKSAIWFVKECHAHRRVCKSVGVKEAFLDLTCYLAHDCMHPSNILAGHFQPPIFRTFPLHVQTLSDVLGCLKRHHVNGDRNAVAVAKRATKCALWCHGAKSANGEMSHAAANVAEGTK